MRRLTSNQTLLGRQRRMRTSSDSLQALLWVAWALLVAATAYASWRADMLAQHPLNLLGLAIHCGVAGVIGLVVLTLIEMRLWPTRFIER